MSTHETIVALRGVTKRFGDHLVLDAVDLEVERGRVTAMIGKSGTGKSVLLKHIVGLLVPDSGDVVYGDKRLADLDRKERRALRTRFSYMFQSNALFDSMTVFDNVALPLRERERLPEPEVHRRVMDRISQLELEDVTEKFPSQISGGMQKRVALARALVTEPEIVLFDEPTTGLDPIRKSAVLDMIYSYQRRFGFTAVVVSHDIPDVFYIADRVIILDEGKVIFQGTPIGLEQTDDPLVEAFLNGEEILKDKLTGLHTKHRLIEAFGQLPGSDREGHNYALLLIRIENLEAIDAHVGHIAAQRIQQTVAQKLRSLLGPYDFAARFGKGEIAAYLRGNGKGRGQEVRGNLGRALKGETVFQPGQYRRVCSDFSVHAGVAEDDGSGSLEDLASAARGAQSVIARVSCREGE